MKKFEVYIAAGLEDNEGMGEFRLERIIEANNVKEGLEIANEDGSTKWRYIKEVKEKKEDDKEENKEESL